MERRPARQPPAADRPTRAETDCDIGLVREVLAQQIGYDPAQPAGRYAWGEVWSSYDPKPIWQATACATTRSQVENQLRDRLSFMRPSTWLRRADVKTLHAKIGELTLVNDFLAGAPGPIF